MTQFPNVRRHPDGSIDFDFYRRRASRKRRRARQLVFARCLRTIEGAGEAVLTLPLTPFSNGRPRPRGFLADVSVRLATAPG